MFRSGLINQGAYKKRRKQRIRKGLQTDGLASRKRGTGFRLTGCLGNKSSPSLAGEQRKGRLFSCCHPGRVMSGELCPLWGTGHSQGLLLWSLVSGARGKHFYRGKLGFGATMILWFLGVYEKDVSLAVN